MREILVTHRQQTTPERNLGFVFADHHGYWINSL